ncbi:ABC transporter substrate-binding protein [Streptomyces sp. RTGN2]|uniref:ABC transporter substrate-binding protein n=1 Tax=Streptomyces sp. RTGN2 TaxID=3016525 RepID=UPI002553AF2E|nr:ABC transporter substrate-binding protein [Streptomyces sp. RTGN2]
MEYRLRRTASASASSRPSSLGARRMVVATTIALGSVLLAACSGYSSPASNEAESVTVGVAGNIFDAPLRVADARGFFREQGLKVTFVHVTAASGRPSLESGALEFLNSSPTNFLSAVAKGKKEVAIGADGLGNPLGLVVNKRFAEQHALTSKTSPKKAAQTLRGSVGGYSSANTRAEAEMFLKNRSVDLDEVSWVSLASPTEDRAALTDGRIDWFVTSEPLPLQIQAAGDGVVVANSQTVHEWSGSYAGYGQVVVSRRTYAAQHASTVKKFITAVEQGSAYLNLHVDDPAIVPAVRQAMPGIPDAVMQASIEEVDWPYFADMDKGTWKHTLQFVMELGTLPGSAKIESGFWTNDYLS